MNGTEVCFNVSITDDMFVEKNEFFSVHIKTEDRNVWIRGLPYSVITIYDDDRKNISQYETTFFLSRSLIRSCKQATYVWYPVLLS